jgi:2-polyprenyl-3-methyl-5-hydroxy-6-metoxy-1,4-benzoquinol methylase
MSAGMDAERDAFVERLTMSTLGFFDVLSISLGDQLGLYRPLADAGDDGLTPAQLAERSGIAERYAREWLEQQSLSGIVRVLRVDGGHRFRLPAGHAEALLDRDSLHYAMPTIWSLTTLMPVIDALAGAYRTGGGVPWEAYGAAGREGVGDGNRPLYLKVMAREWLPAIASVHERLLAEPPARIADLGCGMGWSSIAIALAYPGVRVDGSDLDATSIENARANAQASGVADRVSFIERDSAEPGEAAAYDLVAFFECLHDMPKPVEALRAARSMLAEGGVVLVGDEKTNDAFTGGSDDLERRNYGWSVFVCLPIAMTEPGSAATGAVMRPPTLRRYASEAGLTSFEILPIDDESFRLYLLRP